MWAMTPIATRWPAVQTSLQTRRPLTSMSTNPDWSLHLSLLAHHRCYDACACACRCYVCRSLSTCDYHHDCVDVDVDPRSDFDAVVALEIGAEDLHHVQIGSRASV